MEPLSSLIISLLALVPSPATVQVDLDGEWLFQVLVGDVPAATFPVYAGTAPPKENLLPSRARPVVDATGARCCEIPMTPMRVLEALARKEG